MKGRRALAFWLVVALQAAVPLALIGWNEVALARGQQVRLATAPVDPYDLFRGRYVRLRYEISRVRTLERVERGQRVYVRLRPAGEVWAGTSATTSPPEDGTFIRGRAVSASGVGGDVEVEYGIETYYADEAEARRLAREVGELYVDVVLDGDGKARIDGIELRQG